MILLYYVYTIKDTVDVPPAYFDKDIDEVAENILKKKYERTIDKDLGVILAVFNVRDIKDGIILPGDPSTHHDVTFDILTFGMQVEEVFVGPVSEIMEFGCFVRIGPVDGLVHLSQITNDFVSFDRKSGTLISKASQRVVKKGDTVYAKISTVSMKNTVKDTKIAMTMRPEGLGKHEWIIEIAKGERKLQKGGIQKGRAKR